MRRSVAISWVLLIVAAARASSALANDEGQAIYMAKCAACHGPSGEGKTDEYADPLIGDKSVLELAALIDKTMPLDKADELNAEDSRKVAAYIHEAFYSPTAQARNMPARIELQRLTVRQYRHTLADLVGSFRGGGGKWGDERGLHGEYFKTRRMRNNERVIDRTDGVVSFDFGEGAPHEQIDVKEFSARWQGSVRADETGAYEFIVKTANGARLWVNDNNRPLIDAWVKSGSDTEYKATIWLLGGRVYPLRLEFMKAKEKTANIALWWQAPHHAPEPIPARNLTRERYPEVFVASTPFPPDDRSIGYERGTAVNKAWDSATTDGAIETASYILANLRDLSGAGERDDNRAQKLQEFAHRFAERAFRRPLTDEQKTLYVERHFTDGMPPEAALQRSLLLILKSPRFLYRDIEVDTAKDHAIAERLAFFLWDSLPDNALRDAANAGNLHTPEQIRAQAERMIADDRARTKLREFLLTWLKVDAITDLSKDPAQYGEFNSEVISDLRTSLEISVGELVASDGADFRQLLTGDSIYFNGRLAKFYGVDLPADAPFTKVAFEPEHRAGLLSHPYLLAGFAYTSTSSPIHRGVFVARNVLGRVLRPPPEAVSPLAPDLHADLTTRERVALQTKAEMCMSCHSMINPLGFTLERFDAVGRLRTEEKGKPVDVAGGYITRSGEEVKFEGARGLADYLAGSEETHTAVVNQLFHYVVKQPINAYGPEQAGELRASLAKNGFNLKRLMVEIAVVAAGK